MNRLLAGIAIALPIAFINNVIADETLAFDSVERTQTMNTQEVSAPMENAGLAGPEGSSGVASEPDYISTFTNYPEHRYPAPLGMAR